jgi:hypothetical protein
LRSTASTRLGNDGAKQGRDHPGTKQTFGRDLGAAVPELRIRQPRDADGRQYRTYQGIRLKAA